MSSVFYCRLCGLELPSQYIKTIEQIKNENLDTIIFQCLHINLNLNDDFPKTTCYNCCSSVLDYHCFLNKVQNVQIKLREIFIQKILTITNIKEETIVESTKSYVDDPLSSNINLNNKTDDGLNKSLFLQKNLFQFTDIKTEVNNKIKNENNEFNNSSVICEDINEIRSIKHTDEILIKKETVNTYKNEINWKCPECDVYCDSEIHLEEHISSLHKIDCVESDSYYCEPSQDLESNDTKSGKTKFNCEKCGKSFKKKSHLQRHYFTHTQDKPIKCDQCGKGFKHVAGMRAHLRKHLPLEVKNRYKCDICNKMLISSTSLIYHKKIHEGTYEYVCEDCGAKYRTQRNLDDHRIIHQTDTPFHCDACSKAFKSQLRLRKHQLVHSDVKPHVCDICGQKFKEKRRLVRHQNTHSTELPFECSYCKKCFREKRFLKIHLRQHTGERPYSCLECNHHFTNSSNYIKHMRGRHGNHQSIQAIRNEEKQY